MAEPQQQAAKSAKTQTASVDQYQRIQGKPRYERSSNSRDRGGGPRNHRRHPATVPIEPSAQKNTCTVCTAGDSTYKCPKCRFIYCSIACCRRHKEEFCSLILAATANNVTPNPQKLPNIRTSKFMSEAELEKLQGQTNVLSNSQFQTPKSDYEELEKGWEMTDHMIASMKDSAWLREELADVGLQHFISKITSTAFVPVGEKRRRRGAPMNADTTTEREQLLTELKANNPHFQRFLDKLLVITGVLERQGDDDSLDQWLTRNDEINANLILKPLPQRAPPGKGSVPIHSKTDSSCRDTSSSSGSELSSSDD